MTAYQKFSQDVNLYTLHVFDPHSKTAVEVLHTVKNIVFAENARRMLAELKQGDRSNDR